MPRTADTSRDRTISALYRKKFSAQEVAQQLHVPLYQVYDALIRRNIPRRNASEQRAIRFEHAPLSFRFRRTFTRQQRDLLIAGIMLYYGEGAKTGTTVDFANSDPRTLRIFMKFLRDICGVDARRIRLYLYCFTDQNAQHLIRFWSKTIRMPARQFTKPYLRPTVHTRSRIMTHGVLHIRYSDKRLFEKISSLTSKISDSLL